LKLAAADEWLKGQEAVNQVTWINDEPTDGAKTRFISLSQRSSRRQAKSQIDLLGLLSNSAEQIGELEKAINFEIAKVNMSPDSAERRKAESRIEQLKTKQKERKRTAPPSIEFNDNAVTRSL
jgi:hypothetical protein